jgi:hypothetical protein
MKSGILSTICLLFSLGLFSQFEESTWLHRTEKAELYMQFTRSTVQIGITGDVRPLNFSTYKIVADTIKLIDLSGGTLCDASKTEAGIYTFIYNQTGDSLILDLVSDECLARGEVLDQMAFNLAPPVTNESIDYVYFQIDDKEIVVKGRYKPYLLKIKDDQGREVMVAQGSNHISIDDLASGGYEIQVWNDHSLQYIKDFYLE